MREALDPDEILLDSRNLPGFDTQQFEGRIEKAIPKRSAYLLAGFFILLVLIYGTRLGVLQIARGEELKKRGENNSLAAISIPAERGLIYDRNGELLAWNEPERRYSESPGSAHILGYVGLPNENEIDENTIDINRILGKTGAEESYESLLKGTDGLMLVERDVYGETISESIQEETKSGQDLHLSIDSRLNEKLYEFMRSTALERDFNGGAAVVMDIKTGEIIAMSSYPEYNPNSLVDEDLRDQFVSSLEDERRPFVNRAIAGLYAPGSIVKVFVAMAALDEGVITPGKKLLANGSISVPHPYYEDLFSVFTDLKVHGWIDMRQAISVSSNIYFYNVGGGFEDQEGLGISKLYKHLKRFGLGSVTGINLEESQGVVPNPEWKAATFDGDDWRLGDTYYTSIGQYGFQVTPMQIARAVGAIATGGELLVPQLVRGVEVKRDNIKYDDDDYKVVREGMRRAVLEGTVRGLNVPYVKIAGKTGTAELGISKKRVNSWVAGYYPYDEPRYSFAAVMEAGPADNQIGSVFVMRSLFDWMSFETPEYFDTIE